jgi:hypothetical protein
MIDFALQLNERGKEPNGKSNEESRQEKSGCQEDAHEEGLLSL